MTDLLLDESVREIDRVLTETEREIDLLLNITPVNAAEAWSDFEKSGFSTVPALQSRPLGFEPDLARRRIYDLEVERVEDPGLARLFKEKRDELGRQITLIEDRDTSRFRHESLQLFGEIGDPLVADARKLLETIEVKAASDERVTAAGFAERAEKELDEYRKLYPGFSSELEIRSDVPELMVSHGRFLIGAALNFRRKRVEPLIQHEIGTHVVTYQNGNAQPLKLLTVGLPGYEETQEGLAVLAEYAVGGLDPQRLRLLAARVVAVGLMLDGAEFLDIFEFLHRDHSFPPRAAWSVTARVARCGGLTKDVIYLRGITRLLEFLSERKRIEPLLVGKIAFDHVPLMEELIDREVIRPAWIQPRWLEAPGSAQRLARVYDGLSIFELIEAERV